MPPDRDDNAGLWDMLTAAKAVVGFVQGRTLDEYVTDLMLRSAVERQIEIIGEAARRISKEFQAAHPEIPWRPIQAQRHVLAHEYGEIKHDRIWRVATVHIPEVMGQLEPLAPRAARDGAPAMSGTRFDRDTCDPLVRGRSPVSGKWLHDA